MASGLMSVQGGVNGLHPSASTSSSYDAFQHVTSVSSNNETTEFTESRSVTLEWKIVNAKAVFESSRGEQKSRCIKSALFDSGRWQIFFYAHNGGPDGYVSVFLSAEPTPAERERGLAERAAGWTADNSNNNNINAAVTAAQNPSSAGAPTVVAVGGSSNSVAKKTVKEKEGRTRDAKGPWRREGKFKFAFEAKSNDGTRVFKSMEAAELHSFSDTARNWGYANFIKRSDLYFNNVHVRTVDAFLLTCTIIYSPSPPSQPPASRLLIPKNLVNAYASLFDDPDYSDVVFRIQRPRDRKARRIYAAKKVLKGRSEYFDSLFDSGFRESDLNVSDDSEEAADAHERDDDDDLLSDGWTSSDDDYESDDHDAYDETMDAEPEPGPEPEVEVEVDKETTSHPLTPPLPRHSRDHRNNERQRRPVADTDGLGWSSRPMSEGDATETNDGAVGFVDATSAPNSPVKQPSRISAQRQQQQQHRTKSEQRKEDGRRRFEIRVNDASYKTYRALLYYLYTDSILFTPLSSNNAISTAHASTLSSTSSSSVIMPTVMNTTTSARNKQPKSMLSASSDVRACSAKSIYRIADKLGLTELKERAHENIVLGLNVSNIMYEVCGRFATSFDEIRKVELAYLLQHWPEVRSSAQLWHVMSDVRSGKYPGFEGVMAQLLPLLTVDLGRQGADDDR